MPKDKNLSSSKKNSTQDFPELTRMDIDQQSSQDNQPKEAMNPDAKNQPSTTKTKSKGFWRRWSRRRKIVLGLVIVLLLLVTIPTAITAYHLNQIKSTAQTTMTSGRQAVDALRAQDLVTAKTYLDETYTHIQTIESQYHSLSFHYYTPLRWHYQDGVHGINALKAGVEAAQIGVNAIEPYADVLGLKGEGTFTGGTIENRITLLLETLNEVAPKLDEINQKLDTVEAELAKIDPARYPFEVQGQTVEAQLSQARQQLTQANETLAMISPIVKVLPEVAGVSEPKKYLIMFQNDAELRPTGGFMTAYAVLNVDKGKVTPEKSDDIYELDNKFTLRLEPPEVIDKYLETVTYWNLRDMNLSPDFKVSMDTFINYYNDLPGEPTVSGVIAIDTKVLESLMEILGPVEVPGYGTFSTEIEPRCNCPQVIYVLEDIATRPTPYFRSDRKAVLGPLMQTMLQKAYDAPQTIWPPLFQTVWEQINQKHVLFYFFNEEAQQAVEANNFAGRMQQVENADFLHINDSNFGGAKSNMFVDQEVEQDIEITETGVKKKLTLQYKNPQKADNCNLEAGELCLNGVLRSWMRVYVPLGSELIETTGFQEDSVAVSEDLGYTVIEGFYTLNPQAQVTLTIDYTVPYQPADTYDIYIQKQPGTREPQHTIRVGNAREEFQLDTDTQLSITY